jgi:hypothetical protein
MYWHVDEVKDFEGQVLQRNIPRPFLSSRHELPRWAV